MASSQVAGNHLSMKSTLDELVIVAALRSYQAGFSLGVGRDEDGNHRAGLELCFVCRLLAVWLCCVCALIDKNCWVIEPVLLLHGYDSKPSALGDLADRLGERSELVAGFEDLSEESFAWWIADLSTDARQDLTDYLDEISFEATRALAEAKVSGLAGMLCSKTLSSPMSPLSSVGPVAVVGFSQGAAAALSWLLDASRQTPVKTVIAVAGFLPDLAEQQLRGRIVGLAASSAEPIHIHAVHLSDDEVVDAMVSERASRQLSKAGFIVTDHHVDGPHAWSPALTDLVTQLLSNPVLH